MDTFVSNRKVLQLTLSFCALFTQVNGQGNYGFSQSQCQSRADCDTKRGEICWWSYAACGIGHCMCHPLSAKRDPTTQQCKKVLRYGDRCQIDTDCPSGMHCRSGKCRCEFGQVVSDKTVCLRSRERLVGQTCTGGEDKCFQKTESGAYSSSDTICMYGICKCKPGLKPSIGYRCRKNRIGESGCRVSYQCEGGAVCIDRKCSCPPGFTPVAKATKCAKIGASHELRAGQECDEVNHKKYCGYGLICHKCIGQQTFQCLRFESRDNGYYRSDTGRTSSGSFHSYTIRYIAFILFIIIVVLDR